MCVRAWRWRRCIVHSTFLYQIDNKYKWKSLFSPVVDTIHVHTRRENQGENSPPVHCGRLRKRVRKGGVGVHPALCFVLCALCFVLRALCFVLRALCFVLCALYVHMYYVLCTSTRYYVHMYYVLCCASSVCSRLVDCVIEFEYKCTMYYGGLTMYEYKYTARSMH